jgi:uncharacterized protein YyaL (SSP411 family)
MARGGMYDQLAGGFARYSVDRTWTVPHFEKMLYDNALLLRVYTHLGRLTGDELARRVADETARFLCDEFFDGHGFISAFDADADGVEGLTYAWTPVQLREVLGDADGTWAADLLGVTDEGTFEHGTSVLQRQQDPDDEERWFSVREKLRKARAVRPQPARDTKVVAAWNGLAVSALVEYAMLTGAKWALSKALAAAELLTSAHLVDGRLRRVSRDGVVGPAGGVLDDYGCVAEAFALMHQGTGDGRWLTLAAQLLDTALARFADEHGGFYDTPDDAERLVTRPADPTDNATPAGVSALAAALVAYSALAGSVEHREAAVRALSTVAAVAARHGRFTGYACAVGEALVSGPYEVAIAGDSAALVDAAWRHLPPGAVVVAGAPDTPGVPLLEGRPLRDGAPTAYVCRGFVCDYPVTTVDDLVAKLR